MLVPLERGRARDLGGVLGDTLASQRPEGKRKYVQRMNLQNRF